MGPTVTLNSASPHANGLVARWPMTYGASGVRDQIGGLTLTAVNSPTTVGLPEFGFVPSLLRSSSQRYAGPAPSNLQPPLAVSCWFRCTDFSANENILVLHTGSSGNNVLGVSLNFTTISLYTSDVSGAFTTVNSPVSGLNNTWYHVLVLLESATSRRMLINGGNEVVSTSSAPFAAGFTDVTVGAYGPATSPGDHFNGSVVEINIYRKLPSVSAYAFYRPDTRWDLYRGTGDFGAIANTVSVPAPAPPTIRSGPSIGKRRAGHSVSSPGGYF